MSCLHLLDSDTRDQGCSTWLNSYASFAQDFFCSQCILSLLLLLEDFFNQMQSLCLLRDQINRYVVVVCSMVGCKYFFNLHQQSSSYEAVKINFLWCNCIACLRLLLFGILVWQVIKNSWQDLQLSSNLFDAIVIAEIMIFLFA